MIKNPRARRTSAVIMVVMGALLLVLGVVLELFGIALAHKAK
jgi:predicted nucleic acid-binding Zn ribbon protein